MTVGELIKELEEFDQDARVGYYETDGYDGLIFRDIIEPDYDSSGNVAL